MDNTGIPLSNNISEKASYEDMNGNPNVTNKNVEASSSVASFVETEVHGMTSPQRTESVQDTNSRSYSTILNSSIDQEDNSATNCCMPCQS